ncbi:MAG: hypothetical protein ABWZ74_11915 [Hyphomicrobiaceae bacterium]
MYWLYEIPTFSLALLFACIFVGFTWLGIIFLKPFLRLLLRSQVGLNDVVGYTFGAHCASLGCCSGCLPLRPIKTLPTSIGR